MLKLLRRWAGLTRPQRLIRRTASYADVFGAHEETRTRSQADVIADLAQFCRAAEPPVAADANGTIDTNKSMILIGRQEVFFRIQEIAHISPGELYRYLEPDLRAQEPEGANKEEGETT